MLTPSIYPLESVKTLNKTSGFSRSVRLKAKPYANAVRQDGD